MDSLTTEEMTTQATLEVLGLVFEDAQDLVIVDSPPGAGKTHLVETVVSLARNYGMRVAVVAPTNEQAFDLVRRLLNNFHSNKVELLLAHGRQLPDDLAARPDRQSHRRYIWGDAPGQTILVATVSKLGTSVVELPQEESSFDLLVCDEAYQVTYGDFMPLAHLAHQHLLVGDPGQLAPTIDGIDLRRFDAAPHKVHWAAPRECLRQRQDTPRVQLPVSRRLPRDTVEIIQPCFYPNLQFVASAKDVERKIVFSSSGLGAGPIDDALNRLASGDTIVGIVLPDSAVPILDVDRDVARTVAGIIRRLLERGVKWGERPLTPRDLGCVAPHVVLNEAIRQELAACGLPAEEIMVEVPELWQGLERPIMVATHPVTGRRRMTRFELEPGRWCVSLSRHLLGCMIVGRQGIGMALDQYQHDCSIRAVGADDIEWTGVLAHRKLWAELNRRDRLIPA